MFIWQYAKFHEKKLFWELILTNTHYSISVLIFAKSGGHKINLQLRNQLIKPNLRGEGVISFSPYEFIFI